MEAERAGTVGAQSGAKEAGAEQEGNGANPGGGPRAADEVEAARGCAGVSGSVEVDETRTGSAGSAAEPARVSSGDAKGAQPHVAMRGGSHQSLQGEADAQVR